METLLMEPRIKKERIKIKEIGFTDSRVIEVINFVVNNKQIYGFKNRTQILLKIGMVTPGNMNQIARGVQSFTRKQIELLIKFFNIDANFLFLEEHTIMFRRKQVTSVQQLIEATERAILELNQISKPKK